MHSKISTKVPIPYATQVPVTITTWTESIGTYWSESQTIVTCSETYVSQARHSASANTKYPTRTVTGIETVIETCVSTSEICSTEVEVPYTSTTWVPYKTIVSRVATERSSDSNGWDA